MGRFGQGAYDKPKEYKERRVYVFTCASCKKERRQSFKRKRARAKECRWCRAKPVDERQMVISV